LPDQQQVVHGNEFRSGNFISVYLCFTIKLE